MTGTDRFSETSATKAIYLDYLRLSIIYSSPGVSKESTVDINVINEPVYKIGPLTNSLDFWHGHVIIEL